MDASIHLFPANTDGTADLLPANDEGTTALLQAYSLNVNKFDLITHLDTGVLTFPDWLWQISKEQGSTTLLLLHISLKLVTPCHSLSVLNNFMLYSP